MQKNYLIRATFHCLLCYNFSTLYRMGKMINYVHFLSIFCIKYQKKIIIHSFVTIKAMLVSRPASGRWIRVTNEQVQEANIRLMSLSSKVLVRNVIGISFTISFTFHCLLKLISSSTPF